MSIEEKLAIKILQLKCNKNLREALEIVDDVNDKNILTTNLKIKLKNNDKERSLAKGTLFTIKSIGKSGVEIQRIYNSKDTNFRKFASSNRVISYEELENDFELD